VQSFFDHTNFRSILREVFLNRREKNARYSLRAFARDIGLSFARTSEIMSREDTGLSRATAEKIAKALRWDAKQSAYFFDLVARDHGRSHAERRTATAKLEQTRSRDGYHFMDAEAIDLLRHWYYVPLLELTTIYDGAVDANVVSHSLGLTIKHAADAIDTLLKWGVLERVDGRLRKSHVLLRLESAPRSQRIRQFHKDMLLKAYAAIERQSVSERKVTSTIMTVRKNAVETAWSEIDGFERKFATKFDASYSDGADAVYALTMQFFKVSERSV
jgi:uncharacterized protein (TIGR02147 family)